MPRVTVFRLLVQERHWAPYPEFVAQFDRACAEVARADRVSRLPATPSQRTFQRWMEGDIKGLPHAETCRVLEHLLGRPARELFSEPPREPVPDRLRSAHSAEAPAHPSGPFQEAAVWPAAGVLAPPRWGDTVPRRAGEADVRVIRSMLTWLTASDHQYGGGHALDLADSYLRSTVQPLLHAHMDDAVRPEMFRVTAELAVRAAWMHLDVGRRDSVRRHLTLALAAAQEADDPVLTAWVLAMRGLHGVWTRDATTALTYTGGALALAARAPWRVRAFIGGKAALARSLTGDSRDTLTALADVREHFGKAGDTEEPAWAGVYDEAYVHDEEAHCHRHLDTPESGARAAEEAEEAMRLRGRSGTGYARLRAFSLSVRALGLIRSGELEQGCAAGVELAALAPSLASRRVLGRLGEVVEAAGAAGRHTAEPAVQELYEAARPLLSGQAAPGNGAADPEGTGAAGGAPEGDLPTRTDK